MAGQAENRDDGTPAEADPGTVVEVRSRFDGRWCTGFEVAEVVATPAGPAFRIRRRSDGAMLPALFPETEVSVVR
jgi:hypothetical protein